MVERAGVSVGNVAIERHTHAKLQHFVKRLVRERAMVIQ